jgi:hypothetical protein
MQGKACAALGFNKAYKSLLIFSFFFPFDTQQVSWEIFEKVWGGGEHFKKCYGHQSGHFFFQNTHQTVEGKIQWVACPLITLQIKAGLCK